MVENISWSVPRTNITIITQLSRNLKYISFYVNEDVLCKIKNSLCKCYVNCKHCQTNYKYY